MSILTWILIGFGAAAVLLLIFVPKARATVLTALASFGFAIAIMLKRNAAYREVSEREKERRKHLAQLEKDAKAVIKQKVKEYEAMEKKQVVDKFKRRFGNGK